MCAAKIADDLSAEELREHINELRKDFKDLLGTVEKLAKAQADGVSKQVHEGLRSYIGKGEDAFDTVRDQAERVYEDVPDTVERNPMAAIMVALGVGFIVGMATRVRK
jgi:ElaB/YqjD/DUF883 family membrane-anchored ribosome-binding protein